MIVLSFILRAPWLAWIEAPLIAANATLALKAVVWFRRGLDASGGMLPSLRLSLEPAILGLSPLTGRSWRERTSGLVNRFGPSALAWLEALLIAADRRASQLMTADPLLSNSSGVGIAKVDQAP